MAPTNFALKSQYSRESVQNKLHVPTDKRGGDWYTGYTKYNDEFFVFANVGISGRTGHDYSNMWSGSRLDWEAKSRSKPTDPQILELSSGQFPVHIFTRTEDRGTFTYQGLGTAESISGREPVRVRWRFDDLWSEPLSAGELADGLAAMGFDLRSFGERSKCQAAIRGATTIYLKRQSKVLVAVFDPVVLGKLDALCSIPGVQKPPGRDPTTHSDAMTAFPRRLHTGEREVHYGVDFGFVSCAALERFIETLEETNSAVAPVASAGEPSNAPTDTASEDPQTETEARRAARLGQGRFRDGLMRRWNAKCALTGLDIPELLRASHIKPWRKSTNRERLNVENGLLLAVHIDGMFDRGLVSFLDDGLLIASCSLNQTVRAALGIDGELRIHGLSAENREFLKLHRAEHFPATNP